MKSIRWFFFCTVTFFLLFIVISPAQVNAQEQSIAKPGSSDKSETMMIFHRLEDKPLHLGDNSGRLDDVEQFRRGLMNPEKNYNQASKFVGDTYSQTIELPSKPKRAAVEVKIFSLTEACATILNINGKIYDLRKSPTVGTGVLSVFKTDVTESLQAGSNSVKIVEEICDGGRGQNDSVFTYGAFILS